MMILRMIALVAGLTLAGGPPAPAAPKVGDAHEISLTREMEEKGDGSSGSSHDRWTIVERVIAVREDGGVELAFDLPAATTAQDRARQWQFPVRVLKPAAGPMQLLDRPSLEARIDAWLTTYKIPRAACGRWGFSWTAYQIECDPQLVIGRLETLDLTSTEMREGALYRDAVAKAPVALRKGARGQTLVADLAVDAEVVRREKAEADVVVGEIMRKSVTVEAALAERAKETVSGTISVTFDLDASGGARRRTKVIRLEVREPGEGPAIRTTTEVVERRPLGR